MKVFLTGGSGYIGGAVARRLIAGGHEVTALVRPASDRTVLTELGIPCIHGDLANPGPLGAAVPEADWVVHAAAELNFASSEERMRLINVDGSTAIARVARECGARGLLNVSSMAVFGGSPGDGSAGDETSPRVEPLPSKYARTKLGGERAVDAGAAVSGGVLRVIHVHPSLVYGPPGKKHGSNNMLRQMVNGKLPAVIGSDRWLTWIHVDDVAEAMVRMLEAEAPRERYLLAGDPIRLGELVVRVSELAGVRPPRLKVSPGVAQLALRALAPLLKGRRLLVARENLENLKRHWHFSDQAAREDLDWRPRSLEESLPSTVRWMKET